MPPDASGRLDAFVHAAWRHSGKSLQAPARWGPAATPPATLQATSISTSLRFVGVTSGDSCQKIHADAAVIRPTHTKVA